MQTGLRTQTAETRDLDRAGNNGCVRSTEKRRKLQDEEKVVRSQKELCDLEKQLFDCKKAIVESRQWKGGESYERIRTGTGRSDHHRVPSPQMDHRDLI